MLFCQSKSSRYVLLKPEFEILIRQNPAFPEAPQLCVSWVFPSWQLPVFCQAEDETQVRDLLLTYLSLLGAVPSTIGRVQGSYGIF